MTIFGVLTLAVVLLGGCGLYAACRPRAAFVVRIRRGVPRAARGRITRGFLRDVAETCDRHDVRRGWIRGVARGRRIDLEFSDGFPGACRQQIRNLWGVSGWPASGPGQPSRTG